MEISLDLDNIDNSLLFGEQFQEKLMEIISAKQKSIFASLIAKETTLFFQGQTTSSFYWAIYQVTNKAMQAVEDKVSCFQEHQSEIRTC